MITDAEKINDCVKWWERKRLLFNLAVGLTGTISILVLYPLLFLDVPLGIIIWGVLANILYSSGILVEILEKYYFSDRFQLYKYRRVFFILGTLAYCLVTFYIVWLNYVFMLFD